MSLPPWLARNLLVNASWQALSDVLLYPKSYKEFP